MENNCLKALIIKFRNKDMSVFPVIFSEFEGLIYHYSAKLGGEDTYQELTLLLLELLYKIDLTRFGSEEGDSLKRYIAVSLGNKYTAVSKAEHTFKKLNLTTLDFACQPQDFLFKEILRDALKVLTKKQRKIVTLKYIYSYSDTEIAESLNISRQAVNRIKNRAMESLREYLYE